MMSGAPRVPQDPEFEARVRASFARQGFMTTPGARLGAIGPRLLEIELPVAAELTQQNGFVHAGALLATLDSACGYAGLTLMPAGAEVPDRRTQGELAHTCPLRDGQGTR